MWFFAKELCTNLNHQEFDSQVSTSSRRTLTTHAPDARSICKIPSTSFPIRGVCHGQKNTELYSASLNWGVLLTLRNVRNPLAVFRLIKLFALFRFHFRQRHSTRGVRRVEWHYLEGSTRTTSILINLKTLDGRFVSV